MHDVTPSPDVAAASTPATDTSSVDAEMPRYDSLQKVLLLVAGLATILVSATAALTPPATGYEASIYEAFPPAFWAALIVGLGATLVVFVLSAVSGDSHWKLGLAYLSSLYVVFHLLPLFRGWALYGRNEADVLSHLGIIQNLVTTGSLLPNDWYPVAHVLGAEFVLLGVPLRVVPTLFTAFFTPVYIVGMFLLGRKLLGDSRVGLVVLAVSVPLLYAKFHHTFHPSIYSFMLLPLFFVAFVGYYRSERSRPYILYMILFGTGLVLFHPVTTIYVVAALMVSAIVHTAFKRLFRREDEGDFLVTNWFNRLNLDASLELKIAGLLAISWAIWYLQFERIQSFGQSVLVTLIAGGSSPTVVRAYGADAIADLPPGQIAMGFINLYGPIFLVLVIAGFASVAILRRLLRGGRTPSILEETWLVSQFGIGFSISLVTLLVYVVAFHPVRNARYMIMIATLLAGLFVFWTIFGSWTRSPTVRRLATVALVVLLVGAVGVSVTNTYNSSYHLTYAEEYGTDWFYENRPTTHETRAVSMDVSYKMRMYSEGPQYDSSGFFEYGDRYSIPTGFGYDSRPSVSAFVDDTPTYMVTKEHDIEGLAPLDPRTRELHQKYDAADLNRLESDSGAQRVYANGGYSVWYVPGLGVTP